jgi:glyoxylase-like metal-dependent hydrolase (beta-lactamase superfamily II)
MNRSWVAGIFAGIAALTAAAAAYQTPQQPQGPKVVEVEKLKDNLYMLKGGGGNTAVFVGRAGVVVVDTKLPGWGQPILDKIKELTPKPVTTIINTHTHGDHVSGNVEFPATVDIIVQENTKTNMEKMMNPPGIGAPGATPPNIFQQNNGKGMPKRTFKDTLTIGKGADEIDLYYFGRGHTNGDAWVVWPALRFAHAGDIFSGKNLPLLDTNNGGSGVEIGDSLAKAHAGIKNVDSIITGHSTVMTWADLAEYAQFNKDFLADVQAGLKAGKSPDDIAASWKIADKYKGYQIQDARLKQNVAAIAGELKK